MSLPHILEIGEYQIFKQKLIGKGQYGLVYECNYRNTRMCAKIIQRENNLKYIEREISILNQMKNQPIQNPNLVYIYDVIDQHDPKNIYIFMEYCQGGDLKAEMHKKKKLKEWYTVQEVLNIISQLIKGYLFLFESKFIHRDLKPANILIQNGIYKLTDFGLGRQLSNDQITQVGTPSYTAPEVYFSQKYDDKADVYSLGVIFYELLYQDLPIKGRNNAELLAKLRDSQENKIIYPDIDIDKHDKIKGFLQSMLEYDPNDRISWKELFKNSSFFQIQYHFRRYSMKVFGEAQLKYLKLQGNCFYHFIHKNYTINQPPKGLDQLNHYIQILMIKGDIAYYIVLQMQEELKKIEIDDDKFYIIFSLIAYKYSIICNILKICNNYELDNLTKDWSNAIDNLEDLSSLYKQSQEKDIVEIKKCILQQFPYFSASHHDLQQKIKQIGNFNQIFKNDLIDLITSDSQDYSKYFQFYTLLNHQIPKIGVSNNLREQMNRFQDLESQFPQSEYYLSSPANISHQFISDIQCIIDQ